MPDSQARRKATPEEKGRILSLVREGLDIPSIGRQLGLHAQTVNGIVNTARNRGLLEKQAAIGRPNELRLETPSVPPPQLETPPMTNPLPGPEAPVHSAPQPPQTQTPAQPLPAPSHDFIGGQLLLAGPGGLTGGGQATFSVERTIPPDGQLGTHYGSFSMEELSQIYGEGTYKITVRDPQKPMTATEYVKKVGASYGAPRSPNARSTQPAPAAAPRPSFQRPWNFPPQGGEDPEHQHLSPPRAPLYYGAPDRSLIEFARNATSGESAVAGKAIEMLGQANQRMADQVEEARKSGPDTYVTRFLEAQQETWNKRWEEERRRDEERRRHDEEKWQRKQEEDRLRYEREQSAERERHQRELDRIRLDNEAREKREIQERADRERREAEQRKFLLEIEEKRIQLMQDKAKNDQDRLETQIKQSNEGMRRLQESTQNELQSTREATARQIQGAQEELNKQLERDREQLEMVHKLKEKGLEKEHQLLEKNLDLQKDMLQSQMGDQLFQTINTVIKEFSKGLEKIVDLQKVKSMTPEAQSAYVARGGAVDGNVRGDRLEEPALAGQAQQQAQADGGRPANGQVPAAGAQEEPNAENRMDAIIKENMKKPFFQEILKEWALHVEVGTDSSAFANLYIEMMRDIHNDESRGACALFATYMKPRNWAKMFAALRPGLTPDLVKVFELPQAEEFYESFRFMVTSQIQEYWEQFVASKAKDQKRAGQNGANGAPVPVEPQVAPGEQSEAEGVPVPSRESLQRK